LISDSFKQDLLNRVDIVDIVERYVPLKKSGTNLSACCPFHSEKTPSFTVSPTKQFYHCFGCGAHGNAISFVMEYQGLGYVEAMRELAEGVGMKLPEFQPSKREAQLRDEGPDLQAALERAAAFYREQLKASPKAIDYLKGRGLTGQIAARFGIGYAPDDWQGLQKPFPDYPKDKSLVDSGLVIQSEEGRRYDRFRDRVMFPILNQRGSVIGFGGRVIGAGEPKYLNSPETPLFEKGRELYGLSQARIPIRESGRVIVVEGYMDVVALAQHGVGYAVATLGTATSATHVSKLLRQTDEVVFCFDGDAAGRRAAWHALEVCLPLLADQKTMRFLFLPPEHDPDSFVREHGKDMFEAKLREAWPLSKFMLEELKSKVDTATPEGRSRLVHEAKPLLQKIAAPVMQLQMLKEVAHLADMAPEEAARACGLAWRSARGAGSPTGPEGRANVRQSVGQRTYPDKGRLIESRRRENTYLRYVLLVPALAEKVPEELLDSDSPEGQLLARMVRHVEEAEVTLTRDLLDWLGGQPEEDLARSLSEEAMGTAFAEDDIRVEFNKALEQIEEIRFDSRIRELEAKARGEGLSREEAEAYQNLIFEKRKLQEQRKAPRSVV